MWETLPVGFPYLHNFSIGVVDTANEWHPRAPPDNFTRKESDQWNF